MIDLKDALRKQADTTDGSLSENIKLIRRFYKMLGITVEICITDHLFQVKGPDGTELQRAAGDGAAKSAAEIVDALKAAALNLAESVYRAGV